MKKTSSLSRCLAVFAVFLMGAGAASASASLDSQLRWVPANLGGGTVTLDPNSRLLLARSAADRAGLKDVGLDFRDVYGVINAETSWVPRAGLGRNGVVSQGLGQFEPATAKAVGLRNPNDAVEAVHAAARLLREAAVWSAQRIARLGLSPEQRAAKLREGISIYYNLSTRARSTWSGLNTEQLPVETLRHIRNVRAGALQADKLNASLGGPAMPALPQVALPAVAAAGAERPAAVRTAAATPRTIGTIEWSGKGESGRRSYVVLSNGVVKPQSGGDLPPGAIQWTRRANG
ncbi:hypothetical protein LZ009_13230 [Ramlibacter sp. XY19]|uniref:hypothetical protein n=1 Tax=Ramlibacter paludis TaxID=2908000 RepID=UPI0023DA362B|nr:hypothetical protein [Ramlibacter paludis]MCG2593744.1 hypothetical protein [Ramlibacter paludis]